MTCTTCTELDPPIAAPQRAGLAGKLGSALRGLLPRARLDLGSLSDHELRDLGLCDGRAAPARCWMGD